MTDPQRQQWYVSPKGNDAWDGTGKRPLAFLAAARDASRKQAGRPRQIILGGGNYPLTQPVTFGPEDSGLTIKAAPGEQPVLYGGRRLTDWVPEGERFWSAPVPGSAEGAWDFRQLYVNGESRPRARLPETGTWKHASTFDEPFDECHDPLPSVEKRSALIYKAEQLPADFALKNAELVILHVWDESHTRAAAHDPAARTLRLDPACIWPPGAFGVKEYYVLNLCEGMTKPGQWYLDRERGRVIYWPLPGEEPNSCKIEAPVINTLVRIEGAADHPVADITLSGLTFDLTACESNVPIGTWAQALDGAVMLSHAHKCRLADLTVRRAGGQGIKIGHADNATIERCSIAHVGANGIAFHSGVHNSILSNQVRHVGELYRQAVGIHAINWSYGRIAHNEVSECSYCGIGLGNGKLDDKEQSPAENVVEYNHIWNVMTALDDGGCIYMSCGNRGTVLRGNHLHGVRGRTGSGSNGLYLDIGIEDVTCEQNLVYDAGRPLHVHVARRNVIRNNILICGPGRGREISFSISSDCICERNIIYGQDRDIFFENPAGARFTGNVYWTAAGAPRLGQRICFYSSQPWPQSYMKTVAHFDALDPIPVIAGLPRPGDWDRAWKISRFVDAFCIAPPKGQRGEVRLLREGTNLHIRARIERPPEDKQTGGSVFGRERFTLLLKPFAERADMVHLVVGSDGEKAAHWPGSAPANFAWRADVQPLPDDQGWETTLCIPLEELAAACGGGTPAPAFLIGFALKHTVDFHGWQAQGRDSDGMAADPLFIDPAGGDFRLRESSPALKLGFVPFDLSKVGPQPAGNRT